MGGPQRLITVACILLIIPALEAALDAETDSNDSNPLKEENPLTELDPLNDVEVKIPRGTVQYTPNPNRYEPGYNKPMPVQQHTPVGMVMGRSAGCTHLWDTKGIKKCAKWRDMSFCAADTDCPKRRKKCVKTRSKCAKTCCYTDPCLYEPGCGPDGVPVDPDPNTVHNCRCDVYENFANANSPVVCQKAQAGLMYCMPVTHSDYERTACPSDYIYCPHVPPPSAPLPPPPSPPLIE